MPGLTGYLAVAASLGAAGRLYADRRSAEENELEPAEIETSTYEEYLLSQKELDSPDTASVLSNLDSLHEDRISIDDALEPERSK